MRSEAFFGAVYGFGLAVAVWAGTGAERWLDGTAVALVTLAVAAGPLSARLRRGWRLATPLPFALAAATLAGGPASIVVAATAGASSGLVDCRRGTGWGRARAAAFRAGACAVAAAAAALAVRLLVPGGAPGWGMWGATAAWLATWAAFHAALATAAVVLATDLRGARPIVRLAGEEASSTLLQAPLGLALPFAVARPWGVPALGGAILALLAYRYGRPPLLRLLRDAPAAPPAAISRSIAAALARALAAGDDTTAEHIERVRRVCLRIGERLGMGPSELEALGAAALLHDVGRLAVPVRIRAKQGALTADERDRVRAHPAVGAEIVRAIRFPFPVHPIVRHHHEHWDGTGYPDGLRGEEIPLGARILSAVHAYDALLSERPYRAALRHSDALRTLRAESGSTFDPLVVDLLVEELERHRAADETTAPTDRGDADGRAAAAAERMLRGDRRLAIHDDVRRIATTDLPMRDVVALALHRLAEDVPHDAAAAWPADDDPAPPLHVEGTARDWLRRAGRDSDGGIASEALHERRIVSGTTRWVPNAGGEERAVPATLDELEHGLSAPIVADDRVVGVLSLYRRGRGFDDGERLELAAVAAALAPALARGERLPADADVLTDTATGLPNATFLRFEAAHRFDGPATRAGRSGLIAIRLCGVPDLLAARGHDAAELAIVAAGRRLALLLAPGETLVRHGTDTLVVLTPAWRPDRLVRRTNELEHAADDGAVRPRAAHVAFPLDGDSLPALLAALGRRLDESRGRARAVVPFRRPSVRAS